MTENESTDLDALAARARHAYEGGWIPWSEHPHEAKVRWRAVAKAVTGDLEITAQRLYESLDAYVAWTSLDEGDRETWRAAVRTVWGLGRPKTSQAVTDAVAMLDEGLHSQDEAIEILLGFVPGEVKDAYERMSA